MKMRYKCVESYEHFNPSNLGRQMAILLPVFTLAHTKMSENMNCIEYCNFAAERIVFHKSLSFNIFRFRSECVSKAKIN